MQIELAGGDGPPEVDRVDIDARVRRVQSGAPGLDVHGRPAPTMGRRGKSWAARPARTARRANSSHPSRWPRPRAAASIASTLNAASALGWQVGEVTLFDQNRRVEVGGPYDFTSAWKSAGRGRRVGVRRSRRALHVRSRDALLDPARGRRRAVRFRTTRRIGRRCTLPAGRSDRTTSNWRSPPGAATCAC